MTDIRPRSNHCAVRLRGQKFFSTHSSARVADTPVTGNHEAGLFTHLLQKFSFGFKPGRVREDVSHSVVLDFHPCLGRLCCAMCAVDFLWVFVVGIGAGDGSLEQRDNFEVRWEIIDYETPFCG